MEINFDEMRLQIHQADLEVKRQQARLLKAQARRENAEARQIEIRSEFSGFAKKQKT